MNIRKYAKLLAAQEYYMRNNNNKKNGRKRQGHTRLKFNLNLSHNRAIFRDYRLQWVEKWFNANGHRERFYTEETLFYSN